jgi:hypothetical protein
MKKKAGRPRKVLSASERKAVVKMLRNTRNITATVNNLKATGLDISRTRVQAVAREEKLEFKPGAPPVRFTAPQRNAVLNMLRKTKSIAATVAAMAERGIPATARAVGSIARDEGMTLRPGPVPRQLTGQERAAIVGHLRKTKSITGAVLELKRAGHYYSNAIVREVAKAAKVELAHAARRAATPKMMTLAKKLHSKGKSAPMIADAIREAMGYAVTPQTVLKMLAVSR